MSQLTLYNAARRDRDPRKAGAWTKSGRFRTVQWPRAAPLGQTRQRRPRQLPAKHAKEANSASPRPGTAATAALACFA